MVTPNAVYIDANASGEAIGTGHMTYGKPQGGPYVGTCYERFRRDRWPGSERNDDGRRARWKAIRKWVAMAMDLPIRTAIAAMVVAAVAVGRRAADLATAVILAAAIAAMMMGCGFGDGHQPYGRPWILAPFDWLAGELTGCHRGWWWAEDLTVFAGAQKLQKHCRWRRQRRALAFKKASTGASPFSPDFGLSGQVGYMATQSELENPNRFAAAIVRDGRRVPSGRGAISAGMRRGVRLAARRLFRAGLRLTLAKLEARLAGSGIAVMKSDSGSTQT